MAEQTSWTREQLAEFIRETCGPVVSDALKALNQPATDNLAGIVTPAAAAPAPERERTIGQKGLTFGGIVAALAASKAVLGHMNIPKAIEIADKEWKDPTVAKALGASDPAAGGVLIAPEYSDEIIDLLVPRTVIRKHVQNLIDLSAGVVIVSRLTGTITDVWIGEGTDMTASQQATGDLTVSSKQHGVLVPISNILLRRGGPRVNNMVRNDTLRSMSVGEDQKFIRGTGTAFSPKGLHHHVLPANVLTAQAAPYTLAKVTQDLGRMVQTIEENLVPMTAPVWLFSPRTKLFLMTIRGTNDQYAFRDEMLRGLFWGWPFETVNNALAIPNTLGTPATASEVYLFDADEMAIGQGPQLTVDLSTEASYIDPTTGALVSAFSRNQTVMRVISEVDFVARHAEAIVELDGVRWSI